MELHMVLLTAVLLLVLHAGDPEPVWADAQGAYLQYVFTRCSELRDAQHADGDLLLRKTRRAVSLVELATLAPIGAAATAAAAVAAAGSGETESSATAAVDVSGDEESDDVDVEGFGYNENGSVIFDGGSYSVGPVYIGKSPAQPIILDHMSISRFAFSYSADDCCIRCIRFVDSDQLQPLLLCGWLHH